eukprot:Awhi_evm1s10517
MVLQLPCGHTGGSLIVDFQGKRTIFDFEKESDQTFNAAAFYADCDHQLEPVRT